MVINAKSVWGYVFFFLAFGAVQGQEGFLLKYEIDQPAYQADSLTFEDSLSRHAFAMNLVHALVKEGYIAAQAKPPVYHSNTMFFYVDPGEIHQWVALEKGNLEDWLLIKSGYDPVNFREKPFQFLEVKELFKRVLDAAQNNGFPFASIQMDSVTIDQKGIAAQLLMEKGPFITFDTLNITGESRTQEIFLARKLNLIPGEPFSQKKVDQSIAALRNIPYLDLKEAPSLSFQNQEATYYLPVNDRKMNTLDGIIGLLPNEIEENKWLITGQFDLALFNISGRGRNYSINWQRLSQYTQNLRVSAMEPMILGSGIDVKASFHLLKEDTTFLNRDFRLDLGYQMGPYTYISFFGRRQAGDLISVSQYQEAEFLPDVADFRFNNYGIDFTASRLDDIFLPKEGWQITALGGMGNKRLLENTGLPEELYLGVERRSIQYYFQGQFSYYVKWRQQFSSMFKLRVGEMENVNLLSNDLFRLGGLKSIRGFNENYFFANRYAYFNLEPRFYFDKYSYLLIFADMGMINNEVFGFETDWPLSFGGGFSLETGGGIFNFIYAMGKSNTQPLGFNYSRIHFGYTGRF